jgi:hypothetical protein
VLLDVTVNIQVHACAVPNCRAPPKTGEAAPEGALSDPLRTITLISLIQEGSLFIQEGSLFSMLLLN